MNKLTEKFGIVMIFCVAAVAVIAVISSVISVFSKADINNISAVPPPRDCTQQWKNENGIVFSANGMLNTASDMSPEVPAVMYKELEEEDHGDILYIHSRNLVINVYYGDEPIYVTAANGKAEGLSGFDNYIFVVIPEKNGDSRLKLEVYNTEYSNRFGIGAMLIGKENAIVKKLLKDNVFPVFSGVVFIVLGIVFIVLGSIAGNKIGSYLSCIYYGIFLVLLSLGSIFDTSWAHIVYGNVAFAENSQRIFLASALPAFLAFIDSFFDTEHTYPVKILTVLSVLLFPVMQVLNFMGIVTYINFGVYFLVFEMFCAAVVVEELAVFMVKSKGAKITRKKWDYIAVYIFLGCCASDFIVYISSSVTNDDLVFTRLGLYVISTFVIISALKDVLDMIKLGVKAGKIGKIAFTDANTGIGNVAAFRSEFDDLESKRMNYRYIGIVQFDVNNLKVINDSKGHEAGDLLIKTAADIINDSFGKIGNCYRTGGDEFVAIITDDHAPIQCEEAIYDFNKLIDKFNSKEDKPFDLRIAYGVAYFQNDRTMNKSLKDIHKIADERMYDNKKMLKARYAKTPEEAVIR